MTSLTQKLENLLKQKEDLEKRIKEEKQNEKELMHQSSIDRLEALVKPITKFLDYKRSNGYNGHQMIYDKSYRENHITKYDQELLVYNNIRDPKRLSHNPLKNELLRNEEIFVTLIGILKKQDERIRKLEK